MDNARLLALYRVMVTIRQVEESFVEPILDRTIQCPVHLYSGQEAIAAGICQALDNDDYLFGTHRSHGHFLAKGGSLEELVGEVYCRESGCAHGRGGSMHLIDPEHGMLGSVPIVAGTVSLAAGAALASQIRGDRRVTVSFFGDGATGEGVLYEALSFAALRRLPVIFACENNLYSTHMPIAEIRPPRPIADVAAPFGIRTMQVDGNDVLAVAAAADEAVALCRNGEGPVFLELLTYRLRGHVGPNDNIQGTQTDIRPDSEIDAWRVRDPLPRLETHLRHAGIADATLDTIRADVDAAVAAAHRHAAASPRPAAADLHNYVFR